MLKIVLYGMFLTMLPLSTTILMAQDKGEKRNQLILPGNAVTVEDAVSRSHVVVLARLIKMDAPQPSAPNRAEYTATMRVERKLKGEIDPPKEISVVIRVDANEQESAPVQGDSYIFFLTSRPKGLFTLLKISSAGEEDIAAVSKAIGPTTREGKE